MSYTHVRDRIVEWRKETPDTPSHLLKIPHRKHSMPARVSIWERENRSSIKGFSFTTWKDNKKDFIIESNSYICYYYRTNGVCRATSFNFDGEISDSVLPPREE